MDSHVLFPTFKQQQQFQEVAAMANKCVLTWFVMCAPQLRAVRHGGQVAQLAALAHVAAAPRHLHQGPARTADAHALRSGARQPVSIYT